MVLDMCMPTEIIALKCFNAKSPTIVLAPGN